MALEDVVAAFEPLPIALGRCQGMPVGNGANHVALQRAHVQASAFRVARARDGRRVRNYRIGRVSKKVPELPRVLSGAIHYVAVSIHLRTKQRPERAQHRSVDALVFEPPGKLQGPAHRQPVRHRGHHDALADPQQELDVPGHTGRAIDDDDVEGVPKPSPERDTASSPEARELRPGEHATSSERHVRLEVFDSHRAREHGDSAQLRQLPGVLRDHVAVELAVEVRPEQVAEEVVQRLMVAFDLEHPLFPQEQLARRALMVGVEPGPAPLWRRASPQPRRRSSSWRRRPN